MVYLEKSQPAPDCLEIEKSKANGDYKCGEVLDRLRVDFKNKCYICEIVKPVTINVEHFVSHQGDKNLKFDWQNLFYACGHCNNTKQQIVKTSNQFLNCTIAEDNVETSLRYEMRPFPFEKVKIEVKTDSEKARHTQALLLAAYNGTTQLKTIESSNIRQNLLDEIIDFQSHLHNYFTETNSPEDCDYFHRKIRGHLNKASAFTAFKRWIIRDNPVLFEEFGKYLD